METTITDDEAQQVREANASGRNPVVFIHGLWLLPSSWDRWADLFESAGYATLTPGCRTTFFDRPLMISSKWSATSPMDLPAKTSGWAFDSSTVSGSSLSLREEAAT